jgi:hypothetical protein
MRPRIFKYFRYVDMSAGSSFRGRFCWHPAKGQPSPERQQPLATGGWSRTKASDFDSAAQVECRRLARPGWALSRPRRVLTDALSLSSASALRIYALCPDKAGDTFGAHPPWEMVPRTIQKQFSSCARCSTKRGMPWHRGTGSKSAYGTVRVETRRRGRTPSGAPAIPRHRRRGSGTRGVADLGR